MNYRGDEVKQAERTAKREAERRRQDVQTMKSPDDWPRWPLLPIKRWNKEKRTFDCAVLFADGTATIHKVGLYVVDAKDGETWRNIFDRYPSQAYADFEALTADGWKVD